jgi:hypothetical protein
MSDITERLRNWVKLHSWRDDIKHSLALLRDAADHIEALEVKMSRLDTEIERLRRERNEARVAEMVAKDHPCEVPDLRAEIERLTQERNHFPAVAKLYDALREPCISRVIATGTGDHPRLSCVYLRDGKKIVICREPDTKGAVWMEVRQQDVLSPQSTNHERDAISAPKAAALTPYELHRDGGSWLGAARRYLKCNVRGGDTCIWSSGEPLTLTVIQIEDLAAHAVIADREDGGNR